jgi:hypothetical protein
MSNSDIKTTCIYTDGSKVKGKAGSGVVVTQADSQGTTNSSCESV